ncbi:MAG: flagellar basal body rod protein FlgC [Alphaproteobacteria bacterium]|jgi:flagellar basal-body rod protein FlgC
MDLKDALTISASGLKAQGARMKVIAQNVANASSAADTPEGEPYRRKTISFKNELDREKGVETVAVKKIGEDKSDFVKTHDPSHPAADDNGFVMMPNVNTLIEVMDMREAQRSYEANLNVIEVSKTMLRSTLGIIR